jgi:phosphopantetheine--protein transferase-like protein
MQNEIKKIYQTLSGGKVIENDNYIISSKQFSSISSDRFISELKKLGIIWDGSEIIFSDLVNGNLKGNTTNHSEKSIKREVTSETTNNIKMNFPDNVGIDIQEINELPDVVDFWEDEFYKSKFTREEIAYCLTKDNPKQSFSGLYSCKEALVKADNNLDSANINIRFNENGKPFFENYSLSISHSGEYSIAVVFRFEFPEEQHKQIQDDYPEKLNSTIYIEPKSKFKSCLNLFLYFTVLLIVAYLLYRDFLNILF